MINLLKLPRFIHQTLKSLKLRRFVFAAFAIHLQTEPAFLDPQKSRVTNFVAQNIFRGLYRYNKATELVPELARLCTIQKLKVTCELRENLKWSDGSPIVAGDVEKSFERFLSPRTTSPRADILFGIKNAENYFKGEVPWQKVGIKVSIAKTIKITFELNKYDPDFLHRLASPFLALVKEESGKVIGSGPFVLSKWKTASEIQIDRNKNYYVTLTSKVSSVVFKLIDESVLALRMYEGHLLDYLPLLPTPFIPQWQSKADYFKVPLIRFDYLGFGPQLAQLKNIRTLLADSIDYGGFQKIIFASGPPGCSGLPEAWAPGLPCIKQTIQHTKQTEKPPEYLEYDYSLYAIEDLKRSAEWFQHSWKENLGWNIPLRGLDAKILADRIRKNPPPLFRRALIPERPTCLSALETFTSKHPENTIRLKNPEFDSWVDTLSQLDPKLAPARALCKKGLSFLISERLLIPLGPMAFATLLNPEYKGVELNGLYQLDLTDLDKK